IRIVKQEIFKLFMNQISSLKCLHLYGDPCIFNILTIYLGAKNCLKNLSELYCGSNSYSEIIIYQLSQICHNLLSLSIEFENENSNRFIDLISVQKNLRYLTIYAYCNFNLS